MVEVSLHERIQALLNDSTLGDQDIDGKIRDLLHAEYLRQLAGHRRMDRIYVEKYGMAFTEEDQALASGLEPKPLRTFLGRVEEILLTHDLL